MRRISGYSMLELITALAIVAILVALAAPSYRDFTSNNQVTAVNNDLIAALNLARSEATRRGTPVTICASRDAAACADATAWGQGWIVFENAGAAGVIASANDVVQKWSQATGNIKLTTTSDYVQYQPTGTVTAAAAIDVASLTCHGSRLRHIQVSAGGMISTQLQTCP